MQCLFSPQDSALHRLRTQAEADVRSVARAVAEAVAEADTNAVACAHALADASPDAETYVYYQCL